MVFAIEGRNPRRPEALDPLEPGLEMDVSHLWLNAGNQVKD